MLHAEPLTKKKKENKEKWKHAWSSSADETQSPELDMYIKQKKNSAEDAGPTPLAVGAGSMMNLTHRKPAGGPKPDPEFTLLPQGRDWTFSVRALRASRGDQHPRVLSRREACADLPHPLRSEGDLRDAFARARRCVTPLSMSLERCRHASAPHHVRVPMVFYSAQEAADPLRGRTPWTRSGFGTKPGGERTANKADGERGATVRFRSWKPVDP